MVYNFNLGIGWASSGVEYAQAYRGEIFRRLGIPAKFIFIDMFPRDNIEHLTRNIGFLDSEIIWLYSYFTDYPIEPVSFTKSDFESMIPDDEYDFRREKATATYSFQKKNRYIKVYFTTEESNLIHRAEYVVNGCLIRKDYFTSGRLYSEYFAPFEDAAHLYQRRFFNRDNTLAYEEIIDGDDVMYRFPDEIFYSKEEFVAYFVRKLMIKNDDTVLIDRMTGIGQAILQNVHDAKIGIMIHADHYSKKSTTDDYILWNNYYEYSFAMHKHIDFYVAATPVQKNYIEEQFEKYYSVKPKVYAIPVGNLDEIRRGDKRRCGSIISASRLAAEKHIDWAIRACVLAKEKVPELKYDIYGEGTTKGELRELIKKLGADDYITLMGQQNLKEKYKEYELYLSASQSEGFGLSLMEAIGSGDALIGFDVPYGNPTFIREGKNGFLIDVHEGMKEQEKVKLLAECIVKYFNECDKKSFEEESYRISKAYSIEEVSALWQKLLNL